MPYHILFPTLNYFHVSRYRTGKLAKANKGEGVLQFLKRFNRTQPFHMERFFDI